MTCYSLRMNRSESENTQQDDIIEWLGVYSKISSQSHQYINSSWNPLISYQNTNSNIQTVFMTTTKLSEHKQDHWIRT